MPSRVDSSDYKPLEGTTLFRGQKVGHLNLEHRVVLAPLTRMRASKESDGVFVHGDLGVKYYSQRASKGGLLLTEACPISRLSAGYPGVSGIFTASQMASWKRITDAVHAKGGYIYCQLWHVGRATVPSFLGGQNPVGASDIPITGNGLDGSPYAQTPPKPMTVQQIQETVEEYAAASKRAMEAGFDGVEVHGANGYLLDQFLHDNVNVRADAYGGSVENRCRFPLEVIKAVTAAIGAEKVGMRLSPYNYFQDTHDSKPNEHWEYLCGQIAAQPETSRLSYVHMIEPRFDEVLDETAKMASLQENAEGDKLGGRPNSLTPFRTLLAKAGVRFLAAGNFSRGSAAVKAESGDADAVVFGRHFIANPDLPKRLAEGLALNDHDRSTFYGAEPPENGYVDYPCYEERQEGGVVA